MEILKKIEEIIREFFDEPSISIDMDTKAKDVDGWDSLANVQIMLSIEETFGIEPFSVDELVSFKCVGDIVNDIASKVE